MVQRIAVRVLLAAAVVALAGCVVAPYQPYPGYGYEAGAVAVEPPPPRYEVVGVAPYPGWFWISGYWTWSSNRHVWVGGRWEAPRPGYRWTPHRWEPISGGRGGRGWREVPGRWDR